MEPFVEMTGIGSASAAPDVVALDVAVRSPGVSVAAALGEADATMAGLIDAAKAQGLAAKDLQTTGANVYPQYDRDGVNVTSYLAQQSLRLRVRERASVGPLIAAFSQIAGNTLGIDNISLHIDDPKPLLERARREAFDDAAAKARQFATLAGRSLGPVVFVVDSPSGPIMPYPMSDQREMMAAKASGPAVEMGENTVTSSVLVRWVWV
jgi:uncharacterized protein YggE